MTYHILDDVRNLSGETLNEWGDKLGSRAIARSIATNERFSNRVMDQILPRSQKLFSAGDINSDDVLIAKSIHMDQSRMVRLAGIAVYSDVIRKATGRDNYSEMLNNFSAEDLRIGCRANSTRILFMENAVDENRLHELARAAGQMCIEQWAENAPVDLIDELKIAGITFSSTPIDAGVRLSQEQAREILVAIAHNLNTN